MGGHRFVIQVDRSPSCNPSRLPNLPLLNQDGSLRSPRCGPCPRSLRSLRAGPRVAQPFSATATTNRAYLPHTRLQRYRSPLRSLETPIETTMRPMHIWVPVDQSDLSPRRWTRAKLNTPVHVGFQSHFRYGLENVTRDVFEQIGFGLGARAFLIGFTEAEDRPFPICFEPEWDPLAAVDLSGSMAEAQKRYKASDEARMIYSSVRHHEQIHREHVDQFRAEVIRDALAESLQGEDLTFFVGSSALVDGVYEVHPVIAGLPRRWDSMPALSRVKVDRYTVLPSLQHSLVRELLTATADLGRSTPPEDFSLHWSDRSELIRKAAREFVQSVSIFSGCELPSDLVVALNEVSAQPYEGRSGVWGAIAGVQIECAPRICP